MDKDDDSKIFPQRLMEILADQRSAAIIEWLPHGRAFQVKDRNLFAAKVMPLYFARNAKYSSFTRKLNRWNFVRVSSGPELGAYYHEFFLRDKPQFAAQMFCKNARSKLAMSDESSPVAPKPAPVSEPAVVLQRPASPQSQAQVVSMQHHLPPPPSQQQQQQVYTLPPEIPLGLLELLSKGTATDMDASAPPSNTPVPSHLLQQSQYANLLLERQIQILQQEQAKLMLMRQAVAMQQQPPNNQHPSSQGGASLEQMQRADEERLCQLMNIKLGQSKGRGSGPTNHRASAA